MIYIYINMIYINIFIILKEYVIYIYVCIHIEIKTVTLKSDCIHVVLCPPQQRAVPTVPMQHHATKLPKGGWELNVQTATALIQGVFSAALQPRDHLCHILGDILSVSRQLTCYPLEI
jgi:hypothetical protein